ncbi:dnaJ homolog subfamily C member 24 isoform 1-T1 [Sarcoramphus papa]
MDCNCASAMFSASCKLVLSLECRDDFKCAYSYGGTKTHICVQTAYLRLQYHPDKQKADVPAGEVEERVQRFIEIDQAWKILGNEETKKEYDLQQHEDNLTKEWPLHAQIYLEDMSWNEDEQCYTLSCRCGGNYTVVKSETKDVSLVCCDTCSLVIEILQ